jgi:hypothetical protein
MRQEARFNLSTVFTIEESAMNKGRNAYGVVCLIFGVMIGGVVSGYAQKERSTTFFDKNGKAFHIGDVIKGSKPGDVPIKIHGGTAVNEAGTFAAYGWQVAVCPQTKDRPDCKWTETNPDLKGKPQADVAPVAPTMASIVVKKIANAARDLVDRLIYAADGDSIIWGS